MIDMSDVRLILGECTALARKLDGQELDESNSVNDQSGGDARRRRARISQDLQLLANRLEMAAVLTRNEYWFSRGKGDPLDPDRAL